MDVTTRLVFGREIGDMEDETRSLRVFATCGRPLAPDVDLG